MATQQCRYAAKAFVIKTVSERDIWFGAGRHPRERSRTGDPASIAS